MPFFLLIIIVICLYVDINIFIYYNIITNYILSIYELGNFDHVLDVMPQTSVPGEDRSHDTHTNNVAH